MALIQEDYGSVAASVDYLWDQGLITAVATDIRDYMLLAVPAGVVNTITNIPLPIDKQLVGRR